MSNTVYQIITEKIIPRLEAGTAPWRKPSHAATHWPVAEGDLAKTEIAETAEIHRVHLYTYLHDDKKK